MSNFLIIIILIGVGYLLHLNKQQRLKNIEFYNEFMDSVDLSMKECATALKEVSSKLDNFKEVMDKKLDTIESKLKNPSK